jgi:hypothetical protein
LGWGFAEDTIDLMSSRVENMSNAYTQFFTNIENSSYERFGNKIHCGVVG